jgi:hypothetical protein
MSKYLVALFALLAGLLVIATYGTQLDLLHQHPRPVYRMVDEGISLGPVGYHTQSWRCVEHCDNQ